MKDFPKINLQLFADPEPGLTEEEVDQVAEIPVVDSDDPESVERFLEEAAAEGGTEEEEAAAAVEAGNGGEATGGDDPYAFIQAQTSFKTDTALVDGYKNLQSHASKMQTKADELQAELDAIKKEQGGVEVDVQDLQNQGLSAGDIKKIVAEQMTASLAADKEVRTAEAAKNEVKNKLDRNYNDALSMEGWNENVDKVHGIIQRYPDIADNTTIGNPYKLALEMATNPDLMRVYNKYPELLETNGGGLRVAKGMIQSGSPEKVSQVIEKEKLKAKEEEAQRQIDQTNASVAAPSSGEASGGEKPVKDMTQKEVFEAFDYTPDS